MKKKCYAFLTSGTGINYREAFKILTPWAGKKLSEYLEETRKIHGLEEITSLGECSGDTLYDQVRNYCLNCVLIDEIYNKKYYPRYVAGYSMGIYSALYAGNSIDLVTGINLIIMAFKSLERDSSRHPGLKGKMGSIIGLRADEVSVLLAAVDPGRQKVMLANINNEYSVVITGYAKEVEKVLQLAEKEGALKTGEINVSFPYHSSLVSGASDLVANLLLNKIALKRLIIPMISTIDGRLIREVDDIKSELARNLSSPISWHNTMLTLGELGIRNFIEISGTKSLQKIGRFINPEFTFLTYGKICA